MIKKLIRLVKAPAFVAGLMVGAALPGTASAQGWLTLQSPDTAIRHPAPGSVMSVRVFVDMSQLGGNIDAISSAMSWDPAFMTLDSIKRSAFGPLSNIDSVRIAGTLKFTARSSTPVSITTDVATLFFKTALAPGGTRLSIAASDASLAGTSLASGQLVGWTNDICVALPGVWGDVNGDSQVDIIDAQQIALASVGATVDSAFRLANNGDVNADGDVDILDAQALARYAVHLSAPARINQVRFVPPVAASLIMNKETVTLAVDSTTSLVATPFGADGFTIVGCQSSTWSSTDATIVRVNPTGQITALRQGTATITATSGTATKQSVVTVP
jgi:hypothetical protein